MEPARSMSLLALVFADQRVPCRRDIGTILAVSNQTSISPCQELISLSLSLSIYIYMSQPQMDGFQDIGNPQILFLAILLNNCRLFSGLCISTMDNSRFLEVDDIFFQQTTWDNWRYEHPGFG